MDGAWIAWLLMVGLMVALQQQMRTGLLMPMMAIPVKGITSKAGSALAGMKLEILGSLESIGIRALTSSASITTLGTQDRLSADYDWTAQPHHELRVGMSFLS